MARLGKSVPSLVENEQSPLLWVCKGARLTSTTQRKVLCFPHIQWRFGRESLLLLEKDRTVLRLVMTKITHDHSLALLWQVSALPQLAPMVFALQLDVLLVFVLVGLQAG